LPGIPGWLNRGDALTGGGCVPACVALLTSVPPLGTGGGGIMIGTAPGMFGTGAGRADRPAEAGG
jgi:hypothetical protein